MIATTLWERMRLTRFALAPPGWKPDMLLLTPQTQNIVLLTTIQENDALVVLV